MKSVFLVAVLLAFDSSAFAGQANMLSCSSKNPGTAVEALYISDNFQSIAIISGVSYVAPDDMSDNLNWKNGTLSYNDGNGTTIQLSGLPTNLSNGFVGDCKSDGETFDASFTATSGNFTAKQVLITCQYDHEVSAGTSCE